MANYDRYLIAATIPSRAALLGLATAGLLLAAQSMAGAQQSYRGTQADRDACTDDAFRLCGEFVPDEQRILACLIEKRRSLSPACQVVFSRGPQPGRADARR